MLPDWSGRTVVCIASGPSLTPEDCAVVRLSGHPTIVTNTTFRLCTWANALFGFDFDWWTRYIDEVKAVFGGHLFSKTSRARRLGVESVAQNPAFVSFGMSGTDSISLAIACGSRRIVALGYDCQFTFGLSHHHGDHPEGMRNCNTMHQWAAKFSRLARYTKDMKASVTNASRETALTCFERGSLEQCL